MSKTTNLDLELTGTSSEDTSQSFLTWRQKINGESSDSNMNKIDAAVGELKSAIDLTNADVSNMREAFVKSTNLFNADDPNVIFAGYITNTGGEYTDRTNALSESGFIAVDPSTAYTIGADGSDHPRFVTEYDASKQVISDGGGNDENITTGANTAYIRFAYRNAYSNWRMNKGSTLLPYEPYYSDEIKTDTELDDDKLPANAAAVGARLAAVDDDIDGVKDEIDDISSKYTKTDTTASYYTTPWNSGGGINKDGTLVSVDTWAYTNKISVSEGDVITCDRLNGSSQRDSANIRYLCAYNGDTPVSDAGSNSDLASYTVPSGVTHVVVTQASFTSYTGQRVIVAQYNSNTTTYLKQNQIGGYVQSGSLSDGEQFTFPITNVKQYKIFAFSATVSAFSSLLIGRFNNNAAIESVEIKTDRVTVTNTYGASTDFLYPTTQSQPTDPPVFTVNENIQVLIATGKRNRLTLIRVISNGVVFEVGENQLVNITWNTDVGFPFVKSVGSTLTDCYASWTTRKINAPIWIFGDSYITYDPVRWVYYLIEDGYDVDCLINGYAGENSANAITALDSLIDSARPQMIVWALGMNDGDTSNAINANWAACIEHVKTVCNGCGIKLILCTIPTTPIINNNFKNAWIKASGYRYIDFAAGVGADSSGNWFTGLLSSDNVHPTAEGAKTLYYTFLSQFPEIVINN